LQNNNLHFCVYSGINLTFASNLHQVIPASSFLKAETSLMASKKQSTQPTVTEKASKATKTVKTAKTVAAPVAEKAVKAAPVAEKTVKAAPAKKTTEKVAVTAVKTSKVTFTLPKEAVQNAETVAVLGDFNNWQNGVSLTKQKDGSFKTAVELEKGRSYEYRFLINGEKWENDWAAEAYAPTPFGTYNSVVTA
jgi:hypothetical protein